MSQKTSAALVSVACLLMGAGLLKYYFFDPLAAAKVHDNVHLSDKGLFLGPPLVFFGLLGLFAIPLSKPFTPKPPSKRRELVGTLLGVVFLVVFGAIGYFLRSYLLGQIAPYGYRV